jgi:hypothetical protein
VFPHTQFRRTYVVPSEGRRNCPHCGKLAYGHDVSGCHEARTLSRWAAARKSLGKQPRLRPVKYKWHPISGVDRVLAQISKGRYQNELRALLEG